jgi:hypothetical protein
MRWIMLALMAFVAACSHPSPAFYGVAPVRVSVGQSTFDVRIAGQHAQAIRLSREWAPRTITVAPRAAAAIAAAGDDRGRAGLRAGRGRAARRAAHVRLPRGADAQTVDRTGLHAARGRLRARFLQRDRGRRIRVAAKRPALPATVPLKWLTRCATQYAVDN